MTNPDEAAPVWQPQFPQAEHSAETGVEPKEAQPETPETVETSRTPSEVRRPGGARRTGSVSLLLAISALIALGGVGFAVGRATSSGQTGTSQSNGNADVGQFGGGPNASGARAGALGETTLSGTVVSVSADSITLELASGQTVQVATGPSTTYHGQSSATSTDVTTGATVTVQTTVGAGAGSSASPNVAASPGVIDGSRTATDVTITAK
jgi:hypothetical protein